MAKNKSQKFKKLWNLYFFGLLLLIASTILGILYLARYSHLQHNQKEQKSTMSIGSRPPKGLSYFKIVKTDTTTVPGLFTGLVTIPHNLGYVPGFQAYAFVAGGDYYYNLPFTLFSGGSMQAHVDARADSENFYINVDASVGLQPFSFRYYLFKETAKTD